MAKITQTRINIVLAVLWFLFFFVILYFGWQDSVPLLVFISVYANFVGHVSTWQAAKVEARQVEDSTEQTVQEIKQTQEEEKQTETLNGLSKD